MMSCKWINKTRFPGKSLALSPGLRCSEWDVSLRLWSLEIRQDYLHQWLWCREDLGIIVRLLHATRWGSRPLPWSASDWCARPWRSIGQWYNIGKPKIAFFPGKFTAASILVSYIVIALFLALYFGHKWWHQTPWMTKVSEVDIFTGREEIERLFEGEDADRQPGNWPQKFWYWLV